ncbi:MAG TPA: tetratricopeptide repeat protein, partial [Thioalkalivibrio sp.]|nr:tetratricopeptide repeat protein [Thioalkalivibrio sp.]
MHRARLLKASLLTGILALTQPLHASIFQGDLPDSIQPELEAPAFPGTSADPELSDALDQLNQGQVSQAVDSTRAYLQRNPSSAPAWEVLGAALVMDGELDEGLQALRRSVSLNPGQYTAWTKIGDVLMALGNTEEAQQQFERAIEIAPDHRLPHQRLGLIHEAAGRTDQAIHHLERGLEGVPDSYLGVRVNLARLYNGRGRFQESIRLLEGRLTEATPPDVHVLLGTAHLETGSPQKGLSEMRRATSKAPDNIDYTLALGIALRAAGEPAEAVTRLEKVIEEDPDSPV